MIFVDLKKNIKHNDTTPKCIYTWDFSLMLSYYINSKNPLNLKKKKTLQMLNVLTISFGTCENVIILCFWNLIFSLIYRRLSTHVAIGRF